MNRERATPLVLASLAVLALGAAAATLDSARRGPVAGSGSSQGLPRPTPSPAPPEELSILFEVLLGLLVVVALAAVARWLYREGRSAVVTTLVALAVVALLVLVVYSLFPFGGPLPGVNASNAGNGSGLFGGNGPGLFPGGGNGGGESSLPIAAIRPAPALLALLAVVLVGAVAVVVRATGDGGPPDPAAEPEPSDPVDVRAVGAAAGRAADRIDADADLSNAVFRAWKEMTDHLDVSNPDASTPGEFEAAAVAAGMDPADVRELTGLFEAVRYGGVDADETREERAVVALRRIERTYGGDG
ncbi:DUF4129 domain-containing protein [Halomarina pelagica]|uniref:DUF4129 domain-containing protein n=1 Tax=Halomarina pelagica TaxID=2961599 RepID=UPI0020C3879D|nr:DUF4129 domain-containing protein [Halomarina sp. BND7]